MPPASSGSARRRSVESRGGVELEEGVRILSNGVDCPVDQLKTGMLVYVDFEKQNDSVTLPVFRSRGVIG